MLVFAHEACRNHVTPLGHPERVARMVAVEEGLAGLPVERRECPLGMREDVLLCHPASHHDRIAAAVPSDGWAQLDGDA